MLWEDDTLNGREDNSVVGGLATLVLGAAIGAATVLLFTSSTGRHLRSQLVGNIGSWKEQASEVIAQGRERVVSAVEQGYSSGETVAGPGGRVGGRT